MTRTALPETLKRGEALVATLLVAILATLLAATPAAALDGIHHDPYGRDELYASQPTERSPRDPMAGEAVTIKATTWPVEPGQTVWITWNLNGVPQTPTGAAWDYNSGNNSYWQVGLGSFSRGDEIEYTVHADVNGGGQRSTGPFEFTVTSWSTVTDVTGWVDNGTSVDVMTGDSAGDFTPKIRFAFPDTDSFRTEIAPTGSGLGISGLPSYSITDTGSSLSIATSDLVLKIQKSPYRLAVYEADGATLITRQYDPASFRNVSWASDGVDLVTKIEDHLLLAPGERMEGFGERYDQLDQRGSDVHNWVYNQYRNQGSTGRTYLSVPFFLNSGGYGIYVPTDRYAIFNNGTHLSDMAGFTVDTGGETDPTLEYYLFTGTPEDIVDDYTAASGRPQLPPKWAFGLWMSANEWNEQSEIEAELAKVGTYDIPHSAIVLEQWSDEATFYVWHGADYTPTSGAGSLNYSDLTFPAGTAWTDPKSMVDAFHAEGIRVLLWQIPVLKENFDTNPATAPQQHLNDQAYAETQGFVVKNADGTPYRVPTGQWFGDSTVPDFTSTAATDWWMSKRRYLLDDIGIDGFKTDGGEMIYGRHTQFADGRRGDELHNAYPGEYTDAYNDYVQTKTGGDGAIFSRAGTHGAQTRSIYWAGDQESTFAAFREALRAGLTAGQSGVPFWAWDMAGFTGDFPSAELYLRSAAQAALSPVMQYHSEKANPSTSEARTPWNVQARTGDGTVIDRFRHFANVRMNLLPYIWTEAHRSADTGTPMMRAMGFEFPGDANVVREDDQYMFGEQLLVAPITTQGANSVDIALPAGEWYDLWNGGRAQGGTTKTYWADTSTIPVYVRAGAIVPMDLDNSYALGSGVGNDVSSHDNLTFRIYPQGATSYDYWDDASSSYRTIQVAEQWGTEVTVDVPSLSETVTLQVAATKPLSVTAGGAGVIERSSIADLAANATGWFWDPAQHLIHVKVPSSVSTQLVVLAGVHKAPYEAEFGAHTAVATNTNHAGYTGTGFVDQFTSLGDAVEVDAYAATSGSYDIVLRYANATGATATRTVRVDGNVAGTVSLPPLANWGTWGEVTVTTTLTAGPRDIRVAYESSDTGAINLDHVGIR
jgi:alpha-glucosidase (family GH31 glycosyl hydrolase)